MVKFKEIKSNNPKLKQSEIAKFSELSSSTIKRYRSERNMLSPYRIPPSSKTNQSKQKTPNTNLDDVEVTTIDLKTTSKDLKTTSKAPVKSKKNELEGDSIKINEQYLEEIVHNNYL